MKKVFFMALAGGLFLSACNKKANPAQTPTQKPAVSDSKPAAAATAPASPAASTPATASQSDLPAPTEVENAKMVEMGKSVYTSRCGRCHGLKNVGDYTAGRWEGILSSMAPKAKLTDDETKQVKAYVDANCKK